MLTFPRVPLVGDGEVLTSRHQIALARAFNERLRSGIGDGPWRLHWYFLNAWRQVRGPDGDLFPANSEFLEFYQHVDPVKSGATWPIEPPGEGGGANLANPMMAFALGTTGVAEEAERLAPVDATPASADAESIWVAGQHQRGTYDPETAARNTPALDAAQSYFRVAYAGFSSPFVTHGKAFGGWMPSPQQLPGDCDDGAHSPKHAIFFTPLKEGLPIKRFVGVCPEASGSPGGGPEDGDAIGWYARIPTGWYVWPYGSDEPEYISDQDYIEGPYTGGATTRHTEGLQVPRMLNAFIADFKGTPEQRRIVPPDDDDEHRITEIAFDAERFFSSQYFLAPNFATLQGADLVADYPEFEFRSYAKGDLALYTSERSNDEDSDETSLHYVPGHVLGGVLIRAVNLRAACVVEFLNDDEVIHSVTITPDESGRVAQMAWFEAPVNPRPLRVRMGSDASFSSPGHIWVQCTQQLEYKPQLHDAYLVQRLASTSGAAEDFDTRGLTFTGSKQLSDAYFANGCIVNFTTSGIGTATAAANVNPVFDAARRLTRDCVRVVTRQHFLGYEVAGGKSILYFKRFALGLQNQEVDLFDGIAPALAPVASGTLRAGFVYIVRDAGPVPGAPAATIKYGEVFYSVGQTFTALAGHRDFVANVGNAEVWEHEGIRDLAPPNGTTNQWLMFLNLKLANDGTYSEDSLFKPDAYTDYFSLIERCHVYSPDLGNPENQHILRQLSASTDLPVLAPESPTGWRYAGTTNSGRLTPAGHKPIFFESCRIYEPPVEIESAQLLIEAGVQVVKLTFKGRLQHGALAPAAIARDPLTWDVAGLQLELERNGRTDENGLREYLLRQATGRHCAKGVVGDAGLGTFLWSITDDPYGACFPHFFFTRMVREPYEDGNSTMERHDSGINASEYQVMELYLRAMCEGWVDGQTSLDYACQTGEASAWDFTFENLCFRAFGGSAFSFSGSDVRPDGPRGFGPLPNTYIRAQFWNQFASAINLLTRARIMLPMALQFRYRQYTGVANATPTWGTACTGAGVLKSIWTGQPPAADTLTDTTEWEDAGAGAAGCGASLLASCVGGDYQVFSTRSVADYRFRLISPESAAAVPPALRELLDAGAVGFVGRMVGGTQIPQAIATNSLGASAPCCTVAQAAAHDNCGYLFDGGAGVGYRFENVGTETNTCALFESGTLDPGVPPAADFAFMRTADSQECGVGSGRSLNLSAIGDNPIAYLNVPLVDFV